MTTFPTRSTRPLFLQRSMLGVQCSMFIFLLQSCEKPDPTPQATTPAIPLAPWFTDSAPENPQPIHQIRTTAQPGDTITVSGKIMGTAKPFVEERAAFILGDPAKLTPCNEMPDDHCDTPWDTCCDTPEAKREGTATIQIIDAGSGRVLRQSLKGEHGLKELSTVTVTGTVHKDSTPQNLVINATALHVAP